nr:MAG TPA: hypothetical protein [Caudoviricetes sp.]
MPYFILIYFNSLYCSCCIFHCIASLYNVNLLICEIKKER